MHAIIPDPLARARRAVLACSVVGIVSMAYLLYVHYKPAGSAFCDFGAGFSCEIVNKSVYAEIMGLPISGLGLIFFVAAFALALRQDLFARWHGELQAATVASLVFGAYLTWVEIALLGSICVFCELSKLMMIGVFAATVVAAKRTGAPVMARWTPAGIAAGAVGIAVSRLMQQ